MPHALRIVALSIILQSNAITIGFGCNDHANGEFGGIQ